MLTPTYGRAKHVQNAQYIKQTVSKISPNRVRSLAKDPDALAEGIRFLAAVGPLLDQVAERILSLYPADIASVGPPLESMRRGVTSLKLRLDFGLVVDRNAFLCDSDLIAFLAQERPLMPDIATITAAIGAATSAVGLFDKFADQVERFLTKRPASSVPADHRAKIESDSGAIVTKRDGKVVQRITADDLAALPEATLRHIRVLERSMENHYSIWAAVYPQLALSVDPIAKARIEQQLKGIIQNMQGDLEGILKFLEDTGIHLDDHYHHIRSLVARVN